MGTNPEAARQMTSGELIVELNPQGTLVERVRAAGYGLGGFLTPTGVGTDIANGKQVINVNGRDYLLELPLPGDVAIVRASKVDKFGNCYFNGSTRNFCPVWCMPSSWTRTGFWVIRPSLNCFLTFIVQSLLSPRS